MRKTDFEMSELFFHILLHRVSSALIAQETGNTIALPLSLALRFPAFRACQQRSNKDPIAHLLPCSSHLHVLAKSPHKPHLLFEFLHVQQNRMIADRVFHLEETLLLRSPCLDGMRGEVDKGMGFKHLWTWKSRQI